MRLRSCFSSLGLVPDEYRAGIDHPYAADIAFGQLDGQRQSLAAWLKTPGSGPSLEYEQLIKVFFADHGSRDDALATLEASRAWAAAQLDVFTEAARDYLAGRGPFPERSAVTSVSARFMVDFYEMIDRWAQWAAGVVEQWPDDPSQAEPTLEIDRYILQRAELRAGQALGRQ